MTGEHHSTRSHSLAWMASVSDFMWLVTAVGLQYVICSISTKTGWYSQHFASQSLRTDSHTARYASKITQKIEQYTAQAR